MYGKCGEWLNSSTFLTRKTLVKGTWHRLGSMHSNKLICDHQDTLWPTAHGPLKCNLSFNKLPWWHPLNLPQLECTCYALEHCEAQGFRNCIELQNRMPELLVTAKDMISTQTVNQKYCMFSGKPATDLYMYLSLHRRTLYLLSNI